MIGELNVTTITWAGTIANCRFRVNDMYEASEPTQDIVYVVAYKRQGCYRIKRWDSYDPNQKMKTARGRPAKNKKQKNMDSLRTTVTYHIRSHDPTKIPKKGPYHVYKAKVCVDGVVNITGVIDPNDKYFRSCLDVLIDYVGKNVGESTYLIEHDEFYGINFKSERSSLIDRDKVFKYVSSIINSYCPVSYGAIKDYIGGFFRNKETMLKDGPIEIRIDMNYLNKLLLAVDQSKIMRAREILKPGTMELYLNGVIKVQQYYIIHKLINHKANFIFHTTSQPTRHRGCLIVLHLKTDIKKYYPRDTKLHVYTASYNSYCKTHKEGHLVHEFIRGLFENPDLFQSDEVKYEIL